MSDLSDIEAAVEAGEKAADLESRVMTISDDVPVVLIGKDQKLEVLHEALKLVDQRKATPARRRGIARLTEQESFVEIVNRFASADSAIFADLDQFMLSCVFNYHKPSPDPEAAAWCDHCAIYTCPRSPEWITWTRHEGEDMGQIEFADFLDEHLEDIATDDDFPTGLDLLEMGRDLKIYTQGQFKRAVDPTSGEHSLVCKQEHGDQSTAIPRAFLLGVPVFLGGTPYRVEARIRFRLSQQDARFSYVLHRREIIERDAFDAVRAKVGEATELPIYAGAPEQ